MWSFFPLDPILAVCAAALLGLAVGSWLTTVVQRLPRIMEYDWDSQCRELRGESAAPGPAPSLFGPACHCPSCQAPIVGLRRIPVLGWLLLRGRCGDCRAPIGWRYPAMEILTAILFAACAWRFGPTPVALCAMGLAAALLTLAWIDMETGLLPDIITLPLLWAGLLVNVAHALTSPTLAILGAAAGYGFLWALFHAFRLITGREGMGHGDFKLLAALGAWLGLAALPWVLLAASLAGVTVGFTLIVLRRARRGQPQPFGPYLALAGIVGLLAAGVPPWWAS
jgi:leader peptidase (prepilin peptidase)/N-methyltransferase